MDDKHFQEQAARVVRVLLAQRGLRQYQLVELLQREGFPETLGGIKGKLNRGTFSFSWMLVCCKVLRVQNLPLDWLEWSESNSEEGER